MATCCWDVCNCKNRCSAKAENDAEAARKRAYAEWLTTDDGKEAEAEMASERATRNFLSYDPEAYDEMIRDDLAGKS